MELAARAGLFLDPWQRMVLEGALGERADGRWAALDVGLVLPRQNGKGSILEARELAGLFLFGERLIVHSAHQFDTSMEAFSRLLALIEDIPAFKERVKSVSHSHGTEGVELKGGQRIRFRTRTKGGARGFTADTVILDEAMYLPSKAVAALYPTLSARKNPQVWFVGSAPTQEDDSETLRNFCRRGRAGEPGIAYFEWCADADDDPEAEATVAKANPGYRIRIEPEWVEHERPVLAEDFARERLGVWNDRDEIERVIPLEDWNAALDPLSGPVGVVAFGLAVSQDRDWAAFAVAGRSGRGGTHIEIIDYRPGTAWLVSRAKELQQKWGGRLALASGSPAASLLPELEQAGVTLLEVSVADQAKACGGFYDAVVQHGLRRLDQNHLDVAARSAERKFSGDAWLWAPRSTKMDISPLIAVTLAKWAHDQFDPDMALPGVVSY